MSAEGRFWAKVDRSGCCWLWTAARNKAGYGVFNAGGITVLAHRYAYELENGPIPDGLRALHRCDTPACCRTDHICTGTQAENIADMIKKGRDRKATGERAARGERHGSHIHPERRPRGERHGCAKLTEAQVLEIRAAFAAGGVSQKELGMRHNVSQAQIYRIVRGKSWINYSTYAVILLDGTWGKQTAVQKAIEKCKELSKK